MNMRRVILKACAQVSGYLTILAFCTIPLGSIAEDTGTISGSVGSRLIRRAPAVVYIEKIPGKEYPTAEKHAMMDQVDLRFTPHVLPVLAGTTVDFPNSDTVRHSVFSTRKSVQKLNLGTYDAGVTRHIVMDIPGRTTLLCNVHAEMSAYILTVETPFFATTDRNGRYEIKNVPVGTHKLTVWHERLKPRTVEVEIKAGETTQVTFEKLKKR